MTYFYLFETDDYVYCGQHRCSNDKDPMKDSYKGSGKKWINYLKENNFWLINDFRNNVKKTILEVVMDDENRQVIGNVEKYWIDWSRETYGNKCINISKGSRPNSVYANAEEAREAELNRYKTYYATHKEEYKSYSSMPERKRAEKIRSFIRYNGIVTDLSKLPKKWSEEDIAYYKTRIY